MNVIKVTKINDDGSVAFDGMLGPNEVRYLLEQGVNMVLETGARTIEEVLEEEAEADEEIQMLTDLDEDTTPRH